MNRCFARLAILLVLGAAAYISAQDATRETKRNDVPDIQKFKVKTELMEVRAVVTDSKGRIVENLKKEDFELLENDRPQEISFFSISRIDGQFPTPSGEKARGREQTVKQPGAKELPGDPPARSTLILVDNLHLSLASFNRIKQALRNFVNEQLTQQDMVALATSGGTLGIAQQFTRDRQLLRYAIEQIRFSPIRSESLFTSSLATDVITDREEAMRLAVDLVRREDNVYCPCSLVSNLARSKALQILSEWSYTRKNTLSIIKDFAEQMIRLPGKRMMVIFSDGFTMRDMDGEIHNEELQSVISRAVRSGVVIYSINAKGVQTPPEIDASRNMTTRTFDKNPNLTPPEDETDEQRLSRIKEVTQCDEDPPDTRCYPPAQGQLSSFLGISEREEMNGLHAMAQETGGALYDDTNDMNIALGRAFDANRFYYVLSYYLLGGSEDRRFRSIKVRVKNHPEYTVRTPQGFLPYNSAATLDEESEITAQQRLLNSIRSPLPILDLAVSAQADFIETESDNRQVSLIVYFDGDRLQYREQDKGNEIKLEILYVIYDSSGRQVEGTSARVEGNLSRDGVAQAKTSGYRLLRRLELKPGFYQVRIGVREDGTNRIGTAAAWVEVPELASGKVRLSSLILGNPLDLDAVDAESLDVSKLEQVKVVQGIPLFSRGDICYYYFRVHKSAQAAESEDLSWKWELLRGGKTLKQDAWTPISEEQKYKDSKGWFDVDGEVDYGNFDPGVYELRISVKDAQSGKTVQRTAVFGIE